MAKRIRRARLEAKLSQDAFAAALGVTRRAPQRWEAGEVEPQARHLAKIVEVTGKPIEFFFTEQEPDDDEAALMREIERMRDTADGLRDMASALMRRIETQRREREAA